MQLTKIYPSPCYRSQILNLSISKYILYIKEFLRWAEADEFGSAEVYADKETFLIHI